MQTMPLVTSALARSCKMDYEIITDSQGVKHIIIDRGNGEFTSMPKDVWDELEAQREQSGTL